MHAKEWNSEMASELISGRSETFLADDMDLAMRQLAKEFPEMIQISSIG